MKKVSLQHVGRRIGNRRKEMKLSREKMSERMGISTQFLADIEKGRKNMSVETLAGICSACDLSADYILFGRLGDFPYADLFDGVADPELSYVEDVLTAIANMLKEKRKEED